MVPVPPEKIKALKQAIDDALNAGAPPIAAFDADGTLWSNDMGDAFFNYQIKQQLLDRLPEDPWAHYRELHMNESHQDAYLWLAQINSGHDLQTVRQWAERCFVELSPFPWIDVQKEIIEHLQSKSVRVYVVTASIKWAVEPAAQRLGIPADQVIGVCTEIRDGKVTRSPGGPVTWRQGKVEALLQHTHSQRPFFCSGNSEGDLPLLESASHIRWVVSTAQKGHGNFATEQRMLLHAKQQSWFYHHFTIDA